MRSTFKTLFYINKNRVKNDGTTAIMCRITIDGKNSTIATGLYCGLKEWNAKKGEVKNTRINNQLMQFKQDVERRYEEVLKKNGVVSAEILKNIIAGINSVPKKLLQAGEVERERLRLRSIEINSTSTYRESKSTQLYLRKFIQSRDMEDIAFTDIREEFGESFKIFLKKVCGCSSDRVNKCLCWLNRLLYLAVDREILRANPLEDVEYEKKNPPKYRYLTRNELKLMMETPMQDKGLELARRMFIFSSLTGLAYVDVYRLYPHHIETTSDGRKYIREKRGKTNVEAFVPLHPIAEKILMLYNTTDDSKPVFPLPIRDILWREVHALGVGLGFKENLSYHSARHSFGTLLMSSSISIESIAKMMGHSNIISTQVYARITDDKISEDMDRLLKRRSQHTKTNNNAAV